MFFYEMCTNVYNVYIKHLKIYTYTYNIHIYRKKSSNFATCMGMNEKEYRVIELMKGGMSGGKAYQEVYGEGVSSSSAINMACRIKRKYKEYKVGGEMELVAKRVTAVVKREKPIKDTNEIRKEVTSSINKITEMGVDVEGSFNYVYRKNLARILIEKSVAQFLSSSKEGYTPDLMLRYMKQDSNGNQVDFAERRQIPLPMDIMAMISNYERMYGTFERNEGVSGNGGKTIEIVFTEKNKEDEDRAIEEANGGV